jgi:hypothetical protein
MIGCTSTNGTDFGPRFFHNYSRYSISIQSDGIIENATFIMPLPIKKGIPQVGSDILKENDFFWDNVSIEFSKNPENLNLTGFNITGENDFCFVIVRSAKMIPSKPGSYVYIYHMQKDVNTPMGGYNGFINTLHPVGNESLILPKFNFTWQEPRVEKIESSHIRYQPREIPQKTIIYADYESSRSTQVNIFFHLKSSNEWKEGYDAWIGNAYSESFSKFFTGPQSGWVLIDGVMKLEEGFYPNPDSSEWQKALNQTTVPRL